MAATETEESHIGELGLESSLKDVHIVNGESGEEQKAGQISKSAKESLKSTKEGASLGFGLTRQWIMGKVYKTSIQSTEAPAFTAMVERLAKSEQEFAVLQKRSKKYLASMQAVTKARGEFGEMLLKMGDIGGEKLGPSLNRMGESVKVVHMHYDMLASAFEHSFVTPVRDFLEQIRVTQKLVRTYRIAKQDFDFAQAQVQQIESQGTAPTKLASARQKLQTASDEYEAIKHKITVQSEELENYRAHELQNTTVNYMKRQFEFYDKCQIHLAKTEKEWNF